MRIFILSIALVSIVAPIYSSTDKSLSLNSAKTALSDYEIFAQKYEAAFGEKPSDQIWNLGKKDCPKGCSSGCKTNCSSDCRGAK